MASTIKNRNFLSIIFDLLVENTILAWAKVNIIIGIGELWVFIVGRTITYLGQNVIE